ncbi:MULTISPECIES: hypothetical protein [Microbacterium]|uniref:hypothetical protein n=1 Tax=Microbacterium TaxID=33882 RepID=UPI00217D19E9|nr:MULTISPECIES: hypothetical protein [Microbacterium]UWF77728.1 hypothetical protein JSY13_01200 [Microbacterium neungamense]WCM55898.1 hypothetical protein JRG78_01210 [Microbacterium sp. EF45047]
MGRSIGDEAIKPLLRALDDAPVHVKQLAEMFRKHGKKQHRNTSEVQNLDSPDIVHPLKDGWKKDGKWEPNEVVAWGKGNRPDPHEYLDADYIAKHLDQFADGATRIYKKDSLDNYGPGNDNTTYVFPTDQLNTLMQQVNSPAELAEALGLPDGFFEGAEVELRDFAPHELDGLRMPSGNEGGTDTEKWIPGGYLPTGIPEAVIDIPETARGLRNGEYMPSQWPGSPREFSI